MTTASMFGCSSLLSSYADSQSKNVQPSSSSSRITSAASCHCSAATSTVTCVKDTLGSAPATSDPIRAPSSSGDTRIRSSRWAYERGRQRLGADRADVVLRRPVVTVGQRLAADLLLQPEDAVEQRFGSRRASRHVDIDGDDLVDALRDAVG